MAFKKRMKLSRKASKKSFRKGFKVKAKNFSPTRAAPMRGGIRL